jgi:hypothetical protein
LGERYAVSKLLKAGRESSTDDARMTRLLKRAVANHSYMSTGPSDSADSLQCLESIEFAGSYTAPQFCLEELYALISIAMLADDIWIGK